MQAVVSHTTISYEILPIFDKSNYNVIQSLNNIKEIFLSDDVWYAGSSIKQYD